MLNSNATYLESAIFKSIIEQILTALANPNAHPREIISSILAHIGRATFSSLISVYIIDDDRHYLSALAHWPIYDAYELGQKIPYEILSPVLSKFSEEKVPYLSFEIDLLKPYMPQNINASSANICFPIHANGELIGIAIFVSGDNGTALYQSECVQIIVQGISALFTQAYYKIQISQSQNDLSEVLAELRQMQAQLVQQEKMVGIGQLAAGVAHEINNPLGYVASNFDTLAKYVDRMSSVIKKQHQFIETLTPLIRTSNDLALENALQALNEEFKSNKILYVLKDIDDLLEDSKSGFQRVSDIITSLRNFARTDNNYRHEAYNLKLIIEEVMQILSSEIKYVASVTKEIDPYIDLVCNRSEIGQVMLNLILNAIQAIKENESTATGKLVVRTYRANNFIFIEVEDNGSGISEEAMPHIFDSFYTTKEIGIGTGLGLSISYDIIVNKHGGEIDVDSQPGVGSIFRLKFSESLGGL